VKKIIIIFFLHIYVFALYDGFFIYDKKITLKKDKYYSRVIHRGDDKKDIHIKWTLFINKIITMQVNLDRFNHQFNLKKSYGEQTFKLPLFKKIAFDVENPYLIIKFLEYKKYNDETNNEAIFEIFIKDESNKIEVKDK
jgi:hypothetical protein